MQPEMANKKGMWLCSSKLDFRKKGNRAYFWPMGYSLLTADQELKKKLPLIVFIQISRNINTHLQKEIISPSHRQTGKAFEIKEEP